MARRGKPKKYTIMVVDDHTLVREAIVQMLNLEEDLEVVAETGQSAEVIGLLKKHKPNIILLDIELADQKSGLTIAKEILEKNSRQKIVIMTMHDHEEYALRGLRAGAAGYVLKHSTGEELLEALHTVARGGTHITRHISDRIAHHVARYGASHAYSDLSDREFQVLRGLAVGKTCNELSAEFALSVKTIYTYRTRLLEKLNVKNDIDLLRYVLRHNLLKGKDRPIPLTD